MAGSQTLIGTKLHPPCARSSPVPRPRLGKLLDSGMRPGCRLILISAPAGYGKTTLAAAWLNGLSTDHAWLSLEEAENDPVRFLAYLSAALERAAPEFGAYVGSLAGASQPPAAETVAAELINAIIPLSSPFVLALDDYHAITGTYPHELMRFLLYHQPPHFHLLLATREDPPFPLNRMRVRGEMTEVRMEDLRFVAEEAKEFFRAMGVALREDTVASCTERTEGWAAGLQLAALSLHGRNPDETENFLAAFSGSHRYVIDYLVDEVLSRQKPRIRDFLRRTAVLDRFTPPLCDEVTGRDDSREALREIETNNLFLIPLDGEREWFRYHHLFADSLRMEIDKPARTEVHLRAARWFEDRGDLPEAVRQVLAAGETGEAARLIAMAAPEMLLRGELITLSDWLEALPEEVLCASDDLTATRPWILYLTGRREEAAALLAQIPAERYAGMPAANRGRLLGLQASLAGYLGDHARAADLAREVLLFVSDPVDRVSALNALGQSLQRLGNLTGAETAFREAHTLAGAFPRTYISVSTAVCLSYLLDLQGRRREAESICRHQYRTVLDETGKPLPYGGVLAARLGILIYDANELTEARFLLETGLELWRGLPIQWHMQGCEKLALTLDALGEYDSALAVLRRGKRANSSKDELFTYTSIEAELKRRHGETAAVRRWAETWRLTPDDPPNVRKESGYLTYIRLLLDLGRPAQTVNLLDGLASREEESGRLSRLIPLRVLQALALEALGRREEAAQALGQAVTLAAPEGYVRAFLDQGPGVAALLPLVRDTAPAFVDLLSEGFNVSGAGSTESHARLVEPLTEREIELLRLLAEGLSNDEISRRLFISLNTTKWHLKSIFGKLAAGNRTQAVARAREIGII